MSLVRRETALPPSQRAGKGRVPTGSAEEVVISDASFKYAHRAFERTNQQHLPSLKRKRESKGDSSIVYGPSSYKGPWRKHEEVRPDAEDDASDASDVEEEIIYEEDEIEEQPARPPQIAGQPSGTSYIDVATDGKERSEFLGSQERDYQGRTYMHVPQDLGINLSRDIPYNELDTYYPPREPPKHTWSAKQGGHEKEVTSLRFFPGSGHLLLSSGADAKVLLWDVYHQRELLRSYAGHAKSVTDVDFSPDGIEFITSSFDRCTKLWDTETGQCKGRYRSGATPHVARINPSSPHEFLAGSGQKIVQFDMREDGSKPVQEYDHHLDDINTITYCDENRRFMTTSDDRSLRAWEYGIPVPIKLVADPSLFSMPRASMHPSNKYVAYQSMDNSVVVYSAGEKFRQNRKKLFKGHHTAGSACGVAVSPNGELLCSGDTSGSFVVWDWKTCKEKKKIQAVDQGRCMVVQWHPKQSRLVTGGSDGNIKFWA